MKEALESITGFRREFHLALILNVKLVGLVDPVVQLILRELAWAGLAALLWDLVVDLLFGHDLLELAVEGLGGVGDELHQLLVLSLEAHSVKVDVEWVFLKFLGLVLLEIVESLESEVALVELSLNDLDDLLLLKDDGLHGLWGHCGLAGRLKFECGMFRTLRSSVMNYV